MKLSLVVVQNNVPKEIPVRLSQFLIGRDPQCHLRPASPLVSKRHCAILVREGKVYLRDFESTNGTVLNGQPLKGELELHHQDEIKVGPLAFRIKLETTTPVDTPTPIPAPSLAKSTTAKKVSADSTIRMSASAAEAEDSVIDMLLNLQDDPAAGPASEPGTVTVPPDSTIMEMPTATVDELKKQGVAMAPASDAKKPNGKEPEKKPADKDKVSTSNVAEQILKKYLTRPRG